MVLVRSFISDISPILHELACVFADSTETMCLFAYTIPVYEGFSTKDHGEELGRVLCCLVSARYM